MAGEPYVCTVKPISNKRFARPNRNAFCISLLRSPKSVFSLAAAAYERTQTSKLLFDRLAESRCFTVAVPSSFKTKGFHIPVLVPIAPIAQLVTVILVSHCCFCRKQGPGRPGWDPGTPGTPGIPERVRGSRHCQGVQGLWAFRAEGSTVGA